MTISDAARATRRYAVWRRSGAAFVVSGAPVDLTLPDLPTFRKRSEAEAACDRLNLLAVLEAIREPDEAMLQAAYTIPGGEDEPGDHWRAMIDALIAEVKENSDDA